jgi:ribonuclease Z
VAGFNQAYGLDATYRTAHHGADMLPPEAAPLEAVVVPMTDSGTAPTLQADGLKVTAIKVHHDPVKPAYGYRFDYGGRSVVVSGDTSYYPPLAVAAKGADVLVHEAQNNEMVAAMAKTLSGAGRWRLAKILGDIPSYHATPVQAAQIANQAGATLLVMTHLTPPPNNRIAERIFMKGVAKVRPDGTVIGHDGLLIRLPVNSKTIDTQTIN